MNKRIYENVIKAIKMRLCDACIYERKDPFNEEPCEYCGKPFSKDDRFRLDNMAIFNTKLYERLRRTR